MLEGSERHLDVAEVLEKHHIVHFGDGGPNEQDNLLVVDPTCHRLIHRKREEYSDKVLRSAKEKWKAIAKVLPETVLYHGSFRLQTEVHNLRLISLPFAFESYGLKFQVIAPDSLTVGAFSSFLKEYVVNPIAEFDGHSDFLDSNQYALARSGNSLGPIPKDLLLSQIELRDDEYLNLHIHINVVAKAAPGEETYRLVVTPSNPSTKEAYMVVLESSSGSAFSAMIDVKGTDGFQLHEEMHTEKGQIVARVPGAGKGIEDTIVAHGDFGRMRLNIVFGVGDD